MGAVVFDGISGFPLMPISGGTVNGEPFAVPRGARALTIHVPALVGGGTTVKLQSLAPDTNIDAATSWADVTAFDGTDGTYEALDGIPESTTATFPITATGGGTLRLVASADQSATPVTIPVFFVMG